MKRFLFTGIGGTVCISLCTFFCYTFSDSSSDENNQDIYPYTQSELISEYNIWFIVGTDLWGTPGLNEITLSCSVLGYEK